MTELQKIIAQGEGVQLDFKFRIDDKKKIAHTLAAFANTEGGSLLIGVKDNGKIKGVHPEEEYYMIEGAAQSYCEPEVQFESKVWEEGHYLVLEIIVPPSEVKHKAKDEDDRWSYFVRVEDHTLRANKIVQRIWKLDKFGQERPSAFNEDMSSLLALIRELEPVSISKLYKQSKLKLKHVDGMLSQLVYWGVVQMNLSEHGTTYSIPEE